jgi:hypothetical protein
VLSYVACLQLWSLVLVFLAQHALPHRLHSQGIAGRAGVT